MVAYVRAACDSASLEAHTEDGITTFTIEYPSGTTKVIRGRLTQIEMNREEFEESVYDFTSTYRTRLAGPMTFTFTAVAEPEGATVTRQPFNNGGFVDLIEQAQQYLRGAIPGMHVMDEFQRYHDTGTLDPTPTDGHPFEQDPEEQATLCKECGMWPDHHNHGPGDCVCTECMPDSDDLPDDQVMVNIRSETDMGPGTNDRMHP